MAYTVPTAANLKARFPAFAAVPDQTVTAAIERAQRQVDQSWTEGDYGEGIMLYAAHDMTLDGLGTGADAQANAQGLSGFRSIRSGSLSLERASGAGSGDSAGIESTSYGQRFARLRRQNRAGPRAAVSAPETWPNPYAFD